MTRSKRRARGSKYAIDLASEEDCCTFKISIRRDWRRTPLVLETKGIDVSSTQMQEVLHCIQNRQSMGSWPNRRRSIEIGLSAKKLRLEDDFQVRGSRRSLY